MKMKKYKYKERRCKKCGALYPAGDYEGHKRGCNPEMVRMAREAMQKVLGWKGVK